MVMCVHVCIQDQPSSVFNIKKLKRKEPPYDSKLHILGNALTN